VLGQPPRVLDRGGRHLHGVDVDAVPHDLQRVVDVALDTRVQQPQQALVPTQRLDLG
jgi:hypothetical protein